MKVRSLIIVKNNKVIWQQSFFTNYRMILCHIFHYLNTERAYKRQGHATFEALCWLFCVMVESLNNSQEEIAFFC